jgi:hypothetical protein
MQAVIQRVECALRFEHGELFGDSGWLGAGLFATGGVSCDREAEAAVADLIVIASLRPAALESAEVAKAFRRFAADTVAGAADFMTGALIATRSTVSNVPAQIGAFTTTIVGLWQADHDTLAVDAFANARVAGSGHPGAAAAARSAVVDISLEIDTLCAAERSRRARPLRSRQLACPGEGRRQTTSDDGAPAAASSQLPGWCIEPLAIHCSSPPSGISQSAFPGVRGTTIE